LDKLGKEGIQRSISEVALNHLEVEARKNK
jgi:hypothetical protein